MIELIGCILSSSIRNLFNSQPDIFDFTSQTCETEWNLGHHLANEIQKYIFWLDCDLDLTKPIHGNRRPDMVFHKRGINALNFLVVELKHRGASNLEDIRKIREDWMGPELHYRFGASIGIIDITNYSVRVLHEGEERTFDQSSKYIPLKSPVKEIKTRVDEICAAVKSTDLSVDTTVLERRIDKLVVALYRPAD